MNGKKAKALRRQVYGDHSHRVREYEGGERVCDVVGNVNSRSTRVNTGLRREYQQLKREGSVKNGPLDNEIKQAPRDEIPENASASCPNEDCNWKGILQNCGTSMESEGWEYPEYQVATCPDCGEEVDI